MSGGVLWWNAETKWWKDLYNSIKVEPGVTIKDKDLDKADEEQLANELGL